MGPIYSISIFLCFLSLTSVVSGFSEDPCKFCAQGECDLNNGGRCTTCLHKLKPNDNHGKCSGPVMLVESFECRDEHGRIPQLRSHQDINELCSGENSGVSYKNIGDQPQVEYIVYSYYWVTSLSTILGVPTPGEVGPLLPEDAIPLIHSDSAPVVFSVDRFGSQDGGYISIGGDVPRFLDPIDCRPGAFVLARHTVADPEKRIERAIPMLRDQGECGARDLDVVLDVNIGDNNVDITLQQDGGLFKADLDHIITGMTVFINGGSGTVRTMHDNWPLNVAVFLRRQEHDGIGGEHLHREGQPVGPDTCGGFDVTLTDEVVHVYTRNDDLVDGDIWHIDTTGLQLVMGGDTCIMCGPATLIALFDFSVDNPDSNRCNNYVDISVHISCPGSVDGHRVVQFVPDAVENSRKVNIKICDPYDTHPKFAQMTDYQEIEWKPLEHYLWNPEFKSYWAGSMRTKIAAEWILEPISDCTDTMANDRPADGYSLSGSDYKDCIHAAKALMDIFPREVYHIVYFLGMEHSGSPIDLQALAQGAKAACSGVQVVAEAADAILELIPAGETFPRPPDIFKSNLLHDLYNRKCPNRDLVEGREGTKLRVGHEFYRKLMALNEAIDMSFDRSVEIQLEDCEVQDDFVGNCGYRKFSQLLADPSFGMQLAKDLQYGEKDQYENQHQVKDAIDSTLYMLGADHHQVEATDWYYEYLNHCPKPLGFTPTSDPPRDYRVRDGKLQMTGYNAIRGGYCWKTVGVVGCPNCHQWHGYANQGVHTPYEGG